MKQSYFLAAILAAVTGSTHAGELYRWVDQSGKVHYGDAPEAAAVQVELKKFSDNPAPDAALSFETRRAREAFPVTFYSAASCGELCQQARDLLNKRGVPFTEVSLATLEDLNKFRQKFGMGSVPVLMVGKNWLKGFAAEHWNSELDIAGYPKTVPYGFRPAPPPAPANGAAPAQPATDQPPVAKPEAPSEGAPAAPAEGK